MAGERYDMGTVDGLGGHDARVAMMQAMPSMQGAPQQLHAHPHAHQVPQQQQHVVQSPSPQHHSHHSQQQQHMQQQHMQQQHMQQQQQQMLQHEPREAQPSMMEMVSQAIATMGSRKGSSLQAIKKFLSERFAIDFVNNPEDKNRVSKAVKLGVSRGVFLQEKNSYRLATAQIDPLMMRGPVMAGYGAPHPHAQHPGHMGHQGHLGGPPQHHPQFAMHQFAPMGFPGMQAQYMQQHPQQFYHQTMHAQMMGGDLGGKRKKKKKKKDTSRRGRGAGGLSKPMILSDELAVVCGGHTMGRTDVVKHLWQYIKNHNLQDPANKKMIVCDDRLRRVFNDQERVDMFTMTKMISDHLTKPENQDEMQAAQLAVAPQQPQGFYADQPYDNADDGDDEDKVHHQAQQEQWSC